VKRIAAATALVVVLLSSANAGAAPSLTHQLLSAHQVSGWSKYYIAANETASCPESTFAKPTTRSAVREVFANRSSETLLLERIATSADPQSTYNSVLAKMTKCPKTGSTVDGQVTFPQRRSVNLGHYSVPVRGFTISFVLGGSHVIGAVAYAKKGSIVLAFAELSLTTLNTRSFEKLLAEAISKIA
jgi:hypothetical protein